MKRTPMVLLASSVAAAGVVGCGSSSSTGTGAARATGPVDVLYAGSLVTLMEQQIGPAFRRATGAQFTGFSGGSSALAEQIKGKVHAGDVFVSASPAVNASLTGGANGDWVSWYATFASSPLVLGINPNSRFAGELRSRPWYDVVTAPGFRLGSTDPTSDPKGKLAVQALQSAAASQHSTALSALATSTADVFPEETLVGRLQSGQLDAGFFYSSEAKAAHLTTVPLTGQHLEATYTVTVLNRAPHPAAAAAFVRYLLGSAGTATLKEDGFTLDEPPTVTGTGVPATLSPVLGGH